jgi:hypothetical protein
MIFLSGAVASPGFSVQDIGAKNRSSRNSWTDFFMIYVLGFKYIESYGKLMVP